MDTSARNDCKTRVVERTEEYLHAAKRIAIDVLGTDAAHGHAEVIVQIANIMATLETAEVIAEGNAQKDT